MVNRVLIYNTTVFFATTALFVDIVPNLDGEFGFLTDEKKVILTDRIVWCVMTFLLLLTSVAVVKGELLLFVYS